MIDYNDFENLETIEPSDMWKEILMGKLDKVIPKPNSKNTNGKLFVILILISIINIGFILNIIISNPCKNSNRNKDLQIISKELLINQLQ